MHKKKLRAGGCAFRQTAVIGFLAACFAVPLVLSAQVPGPTRAVDCVVTVTSPRAGDRWEEGDTTTIAWQKSGLECAGRVYIELFKSGVLFDEIRPIPLNDDQAVSAIWTVPPYLGTGDDFTIGVRYDYNAWGESAPFTIHSSYRHPRGWWVFPVASNTAGANGTNWKTDLVYYNPQSFDVHAFLFYCESGQDNTAAQAVTLLVPSMQAVKVQDVVGGLLARPGTFGFLTMQLHWIGPQVNVPLSTTLRVYNDQGGKGTFGQEVQGLLYSQALRKGWNGTLINLTQTDRFRTNIGFSSHVGSAVTVSYTAFRGDRTPLGEGVVELPPFGHVQVNEVLRRFTAEPLDNAFITVTSATEQAEYFAYASVVDNLTGDPGFVLAQ
jgi:hypothetical protein